MTAPSAIDGIIFDVDGTLVDSNDLHAQAWQESFRHFGKDVPFDQIRKHIGKGGDLLVPDLLNGKEMRTFGQELMDYRKEIFTGKYLEQVKPFPGIRETVEQLAEGRRILLASSADPDDVKHYVKLIGLKDIIDGSTSKKDAEFSKPSPEIFEAALEKLGTDADRTITVGDTPYDVLASHRAGLTIVAVLSGGFDKDALRKAEFIFRDVAELQSRLSEVAGHLAE
jgi:HAD superfamily hydrolase (TIGR01509 family)